MRFAGEPVKVACIGTGYFSQYHYDAWHRIDDARLVACVSLDLEDARKTALPAFSAVAEMVAATDPDLVDIITPPQTHLALIRECVENGVRAVICQKPFCKSLEEAREAVAICRDAGVDLHVHENFRFQPWYRIMRRAIEAGDLGDVHQFTFRLRTGDGQGPDAYLDRQPYFRDMNPFLIRETGVHWIDTFCFLFGTPVSVYADLRKLNPAISGEDAGYFLMVFENGVQALFDANRHLDHAAENHRTTLGEGVLEGTNGTIVLRGDGELLFRHYGESDHDILLDKQEWPGFAGDCVYALQAHLIAVLREGTRAETAADRYLSILELQELIYESAQTGRKVTVS